MEKQRFIDVYIRWMRNDIKNMKDGGLNLPLALCLLSYTEFLGSLLSGRDKPNYENTKIYINQCFGQCKDDYQFEVLRDLFRNGMAHEYLARGGISKDNKRPAIRTIGNGNIILDAYQMAEDFLESLNIFERVLNQEKLNLRFEEMRRKSEELKQTLSDKLPTHYTSGSTGSTFAISGMPDKM